MSSPGQTIGELMFEIDGRGARLVLRGPQVGPLSARPAVGVTRDQQGIYHFAVGVNEYVYAPAQLPSEIRRMLDTAGRSSPPGPVSPTSMGMPGPNELRLPNGIYMTFQQYENARVSRIITSAGDPRQSLWPVLPQPVYETMIRFYQGLGAQARLTRPPGSSR